MNFFWITERVKRFDNIFAQGIFFFFGSWQYVGLKNTLLKGRVTWKKFRQVQKECK